MAIIKLAKSGKSVIFVADDNSIYTCSLLYLDKVRNKEIKHPLILTRMPVDAQDGIFPKSPVFTGTSVAYAEGESKVMGNAKMQRKKRDLVPIEDIGEW